MFDRAVEQAKDKEASKVMAKDVADRTDGHGLSQANREAASMISMISTGQSVISNNLEITTSGAINTNTPQPALTGSSDYIWHMDYILRSNGGLSNNCVFGNRFDGTPAPLQFVKFKTVGFEYKKSSQKES